jgi:hypothetical protein
MSNRGYQHRSPLAKRHATGSAKQTIYVDRPRKQIVILRDKGGQCDVEQEGMAIVTAPVLTKDLIGQHHLTDDE